MTIMPHCFHIPVMGLGFTVDTPLKIARFGIDSVVSIMDDQLLEDMRRIHSEKLGRPFKPTPPSDDLRAEKITNYLNFLQDEVDRQFDALLQEDFDLDVEVNTYFKLMANNHPWKRLYQTMCGAKGEVRFAIQTQLKSLMRPGRIDVNIMTKVDKLNYDKEGNPLPREFSDALSSLRGFAKSKVRGSVVFSAGLNPALYSYIADFLAFFPDANGRIRKGIILKVSDYRSAMIQGKFLAKKGLWISEFRIESGLNCGGHAFATNGLVAGPILQEFSLHRTELNAELKEMCNTALSAMDVPLLPKRIHSRLTYQGGLGTWEEMKFLMDHYGIDGAGWGSPFLLVLEATSVDEITLNRLVMARASDYYLSDASPLGVPFNNLRTSTSEVQRKMRIDKNRPGSPCYKKFLSFNTEFTDKPICTASRQYINEKIKSLEMEAGPQLEKAKDEITQKDCLCEGLGASAILSEGHQPAKKLNAVSICPGPNLAYFTGVFSLTEMVGHIYGRNNILNALNRPHFFLKEIQLYVDFLKKEMSRVVAPAKSKKHLLSLRSFKDNLIHSIDYYQSLRSFQEEAADFLDAMRNQLKGINVGVNSCVLE